MYIYLLVYVAPMINCLIFIFILYYTYTAKWKELYETTGQVMERRCKQCCWRAYLCPSLCHQHSSSNA